MSQIRVARLREEIHQQVSDILQNHLTDPRLAWVSVVRVDLSSDLRHAKIYISVLGSDEAQQESLRVLSRAAGAVRSELARRLRLRQTPEILFRADRSIQYSVRVLALLRELGFTGDEPHPSAEDEP